MVKTRPRLRVHCPHLFSLASAVLLTTKVMACGVVNRQPESSSRQPCWKSGAGSRPPELPHSTDDQMFSTTPEKHIRWPSQSTRRNHVTRASSPRAIEHWYSHQPRAFDFKDRTGNEFSGKARRVTSDQFSDFKTRIRFFIDRYRVYSAFTSFRDFALYCGGI